MNERKMTIFESVLLDHVADLLAGARRIEENKNSVYFRYSIEHDKEKEDELFKLLNDIIGAIDYDRYIVDLPTYADAEFKNHVVLKAEKEEI